MRRNAARQQKGRVSQLICVFLLLALLCAIFVLEVYRNASDIGRETARIATYTYMDRLEGYVFREEAAFHSTNNGPVEYLVADGSAVQANAHLANVYVGDLGGTSQREQAAAIYEEIARLERALERDVIAWQASYLANYAEMMQHATVGDWQIALSAGEALAETLEKRSVMISGGQEARVRIATLYAEVEELIHNVQGEYAKCYAAQDGYFTATTDGYEASFGTAAVAGLTPEKLKTLLAQPNPTAENVGKVVSGKQFYLVIPVLPDEAIGYAEGESYIVHMTRGGSTEMLLERISTAADGKEMLLIMRAERMPEGMDYARRQPVTVEKKQVRGIGVPRSALVTETNEHGVPTARYVYVVKDGKATRRNVEAVLCEDGGACIVPFSVLEGHLAVGDQILITSRSMYEGKELIR